MPVSRSIENNVNILANFPTVENISSILKQMPFGHYRCEDITDVIMIPCFILILDALVLTENNPEVNRFECYLTKWSGRMKKCPQCRNYQDCLESADLEEDMDFGPEYKAPIILLHAEKKQRDVEGLVALIPPMSVTEPFSSELEYWLRSTCFTWHKKALQWREESDKWHAIDRQKDYHKQKTYSEIAAERWMPKNMRIELQIPEYEKN
jgi:hypothetical protein